MLFACLILLLTLLLWLGLSSVKPAGTGADDAAVGATVWNNPGNITADDSSYADAGDAFTDQTVISLVVEGSVSGDNKSTGAALPTSETTTSFGGVSDLWGNTLTVAKVNASDFGVVVSITGLFGQTHYLKGTNFGFAIPAGATIDGVVFDVKWYQDQGAFVTNANFFQLTVYYTEAAGGKGMVFNTGSTMKGLTLSGRTIA